MLKVFGNPPSLLSALAELLMEKAKMAIDREGRFNLALSGGSSPRRLYELLASSDYRYRIEWNKVFFFFGDERYVPADHIDSNFRMAREALFEPLYISDQQVFAFDTGVAPPEAARLYEDLMRAHFGRACRFDFILLGLGDNAHTASLFPHTDVLHERRGLVRETYVDEVKMYRLTFTAPLINAAHTVAFLVYGAAKAAAVHNVLEVQPENIEEYPAQLIHPDQGELYWFLDEAAAAGLKGRPATQKT